jgi:hypothetical protein
MNNIKGIVLVSLLAVFFLAFNGYVDGGSEKRSNVITENDIFANPKIKATHQNTVVIELEHPEGKGHRDFGGRQINDIGEKGMDEVTVYYSEEVRHTFCWEDDTTDTGHRLELIDSSGKTVLTVYDNGECENATLTADDYTMRFIHGGQSEGTQAIFVRPNEDNDNGKVTSKQVLARTLLTTNSCETCDLSGANLSKMNLSGADLS